MAAKSNPEYVQAYVNLYSTMRIMIGNKIEVTSCEESMADKDLPDIIKEIKRVSPTGDQTNCYRKFMLRTFSYIPNDSKATVKSVTTAYNAKLTDASSVDQEEAAKLITHYISSFHTLCDCAKQVYTKDILLNKLITQNIEEDNISKQLQELVKNLMAAVQNQSKFLEKLRAITDILDAVPNKEGIISSIETAIGMQLKIVPPTKEEEDIVTNCLRSFSKIPPNNIPKQTHDTYSNFFDVLVQFRSIPISVELKREICSLIESFRKVLTVDAKISITKNIRQFFIDMQGAITINENGFELQHEHLQSEFLKPLFDVLKEKQSPLSAVPTLMAILERLISDKDKEVIYKNAKNLGLDWSDSYFKKFIAEVTVLIERYMQE